MNWLCRLLCPHGPQLRFWFGTSYVEGEHLVARITTEQKIKVTVAPKTAAGRPARIDGDVLFASDTESVATIEVIDGLSAYVHGVSTGAAQITASFDADLGSGTRTLTASGALEVIDPEAETAEIEFGEPEVA